MKFTKCNELASLSSGVLLYYRWHAISRTREPFHIDKFRVTSLHWLLKSYGLFAAFDKKKLIRLAQFYPYEFSRVQIAILEYQLKTYIFWYEIRQSILKSSRHRWSFQDFSRNKVECCVSFTLFVSEISYNFAGCNGIGRTSIFGYEFG